MLAGTKHLAKRQFLNSPYQVTSLAFPLDRVLVKMDILVLGKLLGSRDDDAKDSIVLLYLHTILNMLFARQSVTAAKSIRTFSY